MINLIKIGTITFCEKVKIKSTPCEKYQVIGTCTSKVHYVISTSWQRSLDATKGLPGTILNIYRLVKQGLRPKTNSKMKRRFKSCFFNAP